MKKTIKKSISFVLVLMLVLTNFISFPMIQNMNTAYAEPAVKVSNPTATPSGGEVAVGTEINLSTVTTGTSITYSLNGGDETIYTAPIILGESSFVDGTATIKAVASKEGLTLSDIVTFTYTKKAPLSIISTTEAKAKTVGAEVRVKGIVTYSTQSRTIFMQDASGGICIDKSGASLGVYVGKEVDVIGKIALYGGMVQVAVGDLSNIVVTNENPTMPEPLLITLNELVNSNRVHEGKLIKVENAQIKTIGGTSTGNYNHIITQGGVDVTLRSQALAGKNVGDFITITGVAGYFNNPQIQANAIDVVNGEAPAAEMVVASPATDSTLPIGGTVTLSTATEGATIKYTLNGGAEQTIESNSGTVTIIEFNQEGKAVITAKAVKGDYTTPDTTFTYSQAKTQGVTASVKGSIAEDTLVNLNASENAEIKYTVTTKVGLAGESTSEEVVYSESILVKIADLPVKVTAYAVEEGYLNSDSTTFDYYLASSEPYKNYFGQLHSHTAENSDGAGTLVEAYDYAKNVAKLDFFAVTDHSNSYDTANPDDKAGTYNLGDYNKNNVKWQNGVNAAANARTENFISVYGYEMTWSGGPGHINTFATDGFVSRNNKELNNKSNGAGLKAYYELLKATPNSISQFNHPGATFGNFNDYAFYDPVIDARISLIEVGNGEGAVGSGAYFTSYEEYTKALDKGWHLAPTNNQDNHKKKWGDANTARTVIYTNDLSVEGLYDALRNMRVYATEDNNLDIVYTLNDENLGTIVENVPEHAKLSITIKDPDSSDVIETVSVITIGGKEILSKDFDSNEVIIEETLEKPAAGYYYVKVVQKDGQIAVTAPIWLGGVLKVGIDSVGHDKMMPATNDEMTFTTKLFNNEKETVNVKSIKYEIKGGTTLKTYEPNENFAANGGMYTNELKHTFTEPGIFTLTVTVVLSIDGNDVTYTKDLEVNVRDSEKLILVGIDASHNNEYVSGNYKASMTNFGKLAAKYNVRTVELKTIEELLAALENPKYEMMIFTAPSRRDGSIGRIPFKSYSDAEIQAVSKFAASGKTVIVTGWGDYYESYANLKAEPNFTLDQHMAAQQNKILSAIGSKLRLADDEAKDDVLNGGQSPRLYLTDHNNFVDPFTKGVVNEQVYSQYGGSTVFAVDNDGKAANTLPSSIYPTISGHSSTYSSDDDKDGNSIPPKYNDKVLLMANETITHADGTTSTVVAAGGAFMSNFEIQVEVDNAGTLPYSNYNILENIILSLKSVSSIADVREMPVGSEVIIEGTATTGVYNGSDSNKGFFDSIYVQDATGGINLFPVSSGVEVGQKIRVTGKVGAYQGEKQIQVEKVTVLDREIKEITPIQVTPGKAMSPEYTGSLVKFSGVVSEIFKDANGVVGQLIVDGARVYINGYITKDVSLADIKVGDTVQVTGIASIGENMSSETEFLPRIRIRDRAEIVRSDADKNEITIIHTNDIHGRIESTANEIGMAVISAEIKKLEAANPGNVLVLDAGDAIHGLPIVTLSKGKTMIDIMNLVGYDAMTPGNHDFNYGQNRLLELSGIANFPIISANIAKENNETLLAPYIIKDVNGVKVGIFGLSTQEIVYKTNPKNVEGLKFNDPVSIAKDMVAELKAKGVDVIVALAHIGIDASSEVTSEDVANEVEGIDLIIDGHSHSILPTGKEVNKTLIASAGEYGKNIGVVTISLDDKAVAGVTARHITKAETVNTAADTAVSTLISSLKAENDIILSAVIGNTEVELDGVRNNVRSKETNLGNLIADAMRMETGADVAITNGGGIRASINVGEITKGEVVTVLPFGNYVVTKEISGKDILAALELGVSAYPATLGGFPQISGINVEFTTSETGNKVTKVTVNGEFIDLNKKYMVALNDFMAAGGDNYTMFGDDAIVGEFPALDEVLANYIAKMPNKTITAELAKVEGRIKVVTADSGSGSGGGSKKPQVVAPVNPPTETAPLEVKADSTGKATIKSEELKNADIITINGEIDITLDNNALTSIGTDENLTVSVQKADTSKLSEADKQLIGDRPVYDISIMSGSRSITEFGGNVTLSIPYELAPGEVAENVRLYYINDNGVVTRVTNAYYDTNNKVVVFTTTHFSKYAVGYSEIDFKDVEGWAEQYIYYLADRGIVSGKGNNVFAPNDNITRAEFVKILAGVAGADLSKYTHVKFTDVNETDWFSSAVVWASEMGITSGINNSQFAPNAKITREQMATMIVRFTEKTEYKLTETSALIIFVDQNEISSYATESIAKVQKAGFIIGKPNNQFDPKGNATRAEASKVISILLQVK